MTREEREQIRRALGAELQAKVKRRRRLPKTFRRRGIPAGMSEGANLREPEHPPLDQEHS